MTRPPKDTRYEVISSLQHARCGVPLRWLRERIHANSVGSASSLTTGVEHHKRRCLFRPLRWHQLQAIRAALLLLQAL